MTSKTETTNVDEVISETFSKVKAQNTLIWKGYEAALNGLTCSNMDGEIMEPQVALVKFKDGWRQFAHHNGIEGVSTTTWPINPHEAICNADKN